jgi:hypothetical protein
LIGIGHRAAQKGAVLRVCAAFGCDQGIRQFELPRSGNRDTDRGRFDTRLSRKVAW